MSFQLASFSCVGFSGARRGVPPAPVRLALSRVAPSASVLVGCATGVDSVVRFSWRGSLRVFRAAGSSPGALAARSTAFVRALAAAGGCLVVFPGRSCPRGLRPSPRVSRCFRGFGSGSWASAALAAGLGCPVLCWFHGRPAPRCWRFQFLGGGWWLRLPA